MTGGNALTPTVIQSRTFHSIHGPQGARRNTRGCTAAAVRASRNGSRGAVHVVRGEIHGARCKSDSHVQRARFLARIVQQTMLKFGKVGSQIDNIKSVIVVP